MKKILLIIILIGLLGVSSCKVMSFYPLYTLNTLIVDTRIEGKWENIKITKKVSNNIKYTSSFPEASVWEIKRNSSQGGNDLKKKYAYQLRFYFKDRPDQVSILDLYLIKIGKNYFLDFYPKEIGCDDMNEFWVSNVILLHTFAKVEFEKGSLKIKWFNTEWLEELFVQNKIRLRHERNDEYILLTASSRELQQFVSKYVDAPNTFSEDFETKLRKLK